MFSYASVNFIVFCSDPILSLPKVPPSPLSLHHKLPQNNLTLAQRYNKATFSLFIAPDIALSNQHNALSHSIALHLYFLLYN